MFILKQLGEDQFLSPPIHTNAIEQLSQYMTTYYSCEPKPDDKPTCVTCFDMSGSGKTTTIMEASKNSNSIRVPINLINNVLFRPLFDSCKSMGKTSMKTTDLIEYDTVVTYFKERFQIVLIQLFESIMEKLNLLDSSNITNGVIIQIEIPDYISPTSAELPTLGKKKLSNIYHELVQKVRALKHLLVIHFDDCQVLIF